jgi:hypothetical protein
MCESAVLPPATTSTEVTTIMTNPKNTTDRTQQITTEEIATKTGWNAESSTPPTIDTTTESHIGKTAGETRPVTLALPSQTTPTISPDDCCKVPEESKSNQETFCNTLKTECPLQWIGKSEELECKLNQVTWLKKCSKSLIGVSELLDIQIIANVTHIILDTAIDSLGPITAEFQQLLANITEPNEALEVAENFTTDLVQIVDTILQFHDFWQELDEVRHFVCSFNKLMS